MNVLHYVFSNSGPVNISVETLKGLELAHERNIFHRDIKPDNIFISSGNHVKILDFGIAKIIENQNFTKAGNVLGTIEYMPPEQMLGEQVDHRCDLFAVGTILYQILTNKLPFEGKTPVEILFKKLNEEPVKPSFYNKEIPEQLSNVIIKALKL